VLTCCSFLPFAATESSILALPSLMANAPDLYLTPCTPNLPTTPCASSLAATESSILACLWTLEALNSAWRSSATVCLGAYVKLLAAFSPEVSADHNFPQLCRTATVLHHGSVPRRDHQLLFHPVCTLCMVAASWVRQCLEGHPMPPNALHA